MSLHLTPRARHVVSNEQDIPVSNHPLIATNRFRDSYLSRFSSCVCAIASDRHEHQPFNPPLIARQQPIGPIQTT
jgi:hypothetical protein